MYLRLWISTNLLVNKLLGRLSWSCFISDSAFATSIENWPYSVVKVLGQLIKHGWNEWSEMQFASLNAEAYNNTQLFIQKQMQKKNRITLMIQSGRIGGAWYWFHFPILLRVNDVLKNKHARFTIKRELHIECLTRIGTIAFERAFRIYSLYSIC